MVAIPATTYIVDIKNAQLFLLIIHFVNMVAIPATTYIVDIKNAQLFILIIHFVLIFDTSASMMQSHAAVLDIQQTKISEQQHQWDMKHHIAEQVIIETTKQLESRYVFYMKQYIAQKLL